MAGKLDDESLNGSDTMWELCRNATSVKSDVFPNHFLEDFTLEETKLSVSKEIPSLPVAETSSSAGSPGVACCKKCGKPFTYMEGVKAFIYSCDCDDKYGIFGESFRRGAFDKVVVSSTTGKKLHSCSVCGMTFLSKYILNEHIVTHNGVRAYKCGVCGRCFSQRSTLGTHSLTHTDRKPHQCDVCGNTFYTVSRLRVHLRLHSGDKRHKCQECGKEFYRKTALSAHHRVHSGSRPFHCDTCGKDFPDKSAIRRHVYYHIGYKPHRCSYCGKCFTQKYNFRTHMIIHTGVKAFKCPVCDKSFGLKQGLGSHMKIHEKESTHFLCTDTETVSGKSNCLNLNPNTELINDVS